MTFWFGFGARAVVNQPLRERERERESLGFTVMAFPRGTGVWLRLHRLRHSNRNHSGDNETEGLMQM